MKLTQLLLPPLTLLYQPDNKTTQKQWLTKAINKFSQLFSKPNDDEIYIFLEEKITKQLISKKIDFSYILFIRFKKDYIFEFYFSENYTLEAHVLRTRYWYSFYILISDEKWKVWYLSCMISIYLSFNYMLIIVKNALYTFLLSVLSVYHLKNKQRYMKNIQSSISVWNYLP